MRSLVAVVLCLAIAFALTIAPAIGAAWAADEKQDEGKYTIKDVMKKAHKDGLLKKVLGGNAGEVEKKDLLKLYQALRENEPPQGDAEAWKTRCDAIVEAAQGVVDGKESAAASLKKATDCEACHKEHKGG